MNYHNIDHCDMLNGNGIRVSLWVSGCSLHCKGCQNPQTWEFNSGIPFNTDALQELYEALDKPYIQGLTLTGGNPLDSAPEILYICRTVKEKFPNKDIWLYTGYHFEDIINSPLRDMCTTLRRRIVEMCDVVVDGKYVDELRNITLKWRGSENQRVIDIKTSLKQKKVVLWE